LQIEDGIEVPAFPICNLQSAICNLQFPMKHDAGYFLSGSLPPHHQLRLGFFSDFLSAELPSDDGAAL